MDDHVMAVDHAPASIAFRREAWHLLTLAEVVDLIGQGPSLAFRTTVGNHHILKQTTLLIGQVEYDEVFAAFGKHQACSMQCEITRANVHAGTVGSWPLAQVLAQAFADCAHLG